MNYPLPFSCKSNVEVPVLPPGEPSLWTFSPGYGNKAYPLWATNYPVGDQVFTVVIVFFPSF